jgi:RHS repeat-associated protein
LPADTTWVWDPVTDRLVAIYATGASTAEDVTAEAGLVRQVLHGDQAYDDPLLVVKRNRVSEAPTTFVPLFDEAGTGSLQAVLHGDGSLAERVVYGDSYGDAPRYLTGAVVDRVSFRATKDADGQLAQVTIRAHVSEPIVETSVSEGVRLAVVTKDGALVQASEAVPALEDDATIAWTLGPLEWQTLTSTTGGDALEVALGASLRTKTWGNATIQAPPSWAKTLYGAISTAEHPFTLRQSVAKVTEFLDVIEDGKHDQTTWYEISDLYLAASDESATKLLTGFQAAPYLEPAFGYLYVRARWFDPSTGTWLTPDPMGYQDSSNLYAFCGGDPINCSDPRGEQSRADLADFAYSPFTKGASEKRARRKAALEELMKGPGAIYAAPPGNANNFIAGGLYLIDSIFGSPFYDENSNYHPLNPNEPTQIARDVKAFRERYWAPIFAGEAFTALRSPGKLLKVAGVLLAGFGAFENAHAAAGNYQVLQNKKALNAEGKHVLTELHRMTGEAETLLDTGAGATSEALLFQKYKDRWFSFFFRGRAIQAETEKLLLTAQRSDSVLATVRVRESLGGLVPDFVFNQAGRELIIDITSPRKPSILKALKYSSTGEEIIAEIYHLGRGLK